ncbi:MAG: hypothetical protein IPK26_02735 [Planctomycetes bacterium]|nr:hypothetical protein [Planctomycetota bacterium]
MHHHSIPLALCLAAMAPAQATVGAPAPDLEFQDTTNFGKIKAKKLSQLKGSAVLIELWATW